MKTLSFSNSSILVSFLLALTLLFNSCKKREQNPTWDADELVPLVRTSVNIYNLLKYDKLVADSSGALKLVFNNNLIHVGLDSIIDIPDTTMSERIDTMIFISFAPGVSVNLAQDKETILALNGIELVESDISTGNMNVSIKSTFTEPIIVTYELTSATKNGNPLIITESIPAGSLTFPTSISNSYDLSDYQLNLRGLSNTSFNTLVYQVEAMVDPSGDTLVTNWTDYIEIEYSFDGIKPSYARGYFGQNTFQLQDSEEFHFFANFIEGSINLENVSSSFEIRNGLGADLQCRFNNIALTNTDIQNSQSLTGSIINTPININKALETTSPDNPVIQTTYPLELNSNETNIDDLLEVVPNRLDYDVDITINPYGHVSAHNDFIYEEKGIDIAFDAEVPISISMDGFTVSDTVEFNMGEKTIDDRYLIIDGFIHLYADNWYPFDAEPQLYLLDENYEVIDSILVANSIIEAGILDEDNLVIASNRSKVSGAINLDKIDALYSTHFIKIDFTFTTADYPDFVAIYDWYKVDATVVGDFNYLFDPNE